jgi:hypothetical protein
LGTAHSDMSGNAFVHRHQFGKKQLSRVERSSRDCCLVGPWPNGSPAVCGVREFLDVLLSKAQHWLQRCAVSQVRSHGLRSRITHKSVTSHIGSVLHCPEALSAVRRLRATDSLKYLIGTPAQPLRHTGPSLYVKNAQQHAAHVSSHIQA